ncbi:lipocalin family protein [Maribacter sp. 2308TA10-17]|uniref:lipocalin family protein n=1 Tax=Maribacter sp. 2308TA10-17 TaxID=3386276 RepID=UPI0039BC9D2B
MKNYLLVMAFVMLFSSCSISKAVREKRNMLSGTWTLNDISYENGTGNFKSVLFNDADDICFEGSNWFFRDNNSTGRYTLAASSLCHGGDRFMRWSVVDNPENYSSQLQFKRIDEKNKDISGKGYRLNIATLTASEMVLKSNVNVDGKVMNVVYKFNKKS